MTDKSDPQRFVMTPEQQAHANARAVRARQTRALERNQERQEREHIAAVVLRHIHGATGVPAQRVVESGHRTEAEYTARLVAVEVLRQCGFSSAQIGAVLNRNHSTILHAHQRVKGEPEVRETARLVLADAHAELRDCASYARNVSLEASLTHELTAFAAHVRHDLNSYVRGPLTGELRRIDHMAAVRGLRLVAENPAIRRMVALALYSAGKEAYIPLMDTSARALGYGRAAAAARLVG